MKANFNTYLLLTGVNSNYPSCLQTFKKQKKKKCKLNFDSTFKCLPQLMIAYNEQRFEKFAKLLRGAAMVHAEVNTHQQNLIVHLKTNSKNEEINKMWCIIATCIRFSFGLLYVLLKSWTPKRRLTKVCNSIPTRLRGTSPRGRTSSGKRTQTSESATRTLSRYFPLNAAGCAYRGIAQFSKTVRPYTFYPLWVKYSCSLPLSRLGFIA